MDVKQNVQPVVADASSAPLKRYSNKQLQMLLGITRQNVDKRAKKKSWPSEVVKENGTLVKYYWVDTQSTQSTQSNQSNQSNLESNLDSEALSPADRALAERIDAMSIEDINELMGRRTWWHLFSDELGRYRVQINGEELLMTLPEVQAWMRRPEPERHGFLVWHDGAYRSVVGIDITDNPLQVSFDPLGSQEDWDVEVSFYLASERTLLFTIPPQWIEDRLDVINTPK